MPCTLLLRRPLRRRPTTDIYPNLVCDLLYQSWWCTVSSLSNVMGLQNAADVAARVPAAHKRKYEVRFKSRGVSETCSVDEAGPKHILSASLTAEAKAFLAWLKKRAAAKGAGTPLRSPLQTLLQTPLDNIVVGKASSNPFCKRVGILGP